MKSGSRNNPTARSGAPISLLGLALGAAAAATGLAFWARNTARDAERTNPPMGNFIEVGGVNLHTLARGTGRPVIFIHGLGGMVQDWHLSLLDEAAGSFRCIAFDRPGYGWSSRPKWSRWASEKQAELLRRAAKRMGADRPVLVGHDMGALVALAWALDYPEDVAGLVLVSGYYYPTRRLEAPLLFAPNIAGLGALARNTVTPLLGRAAIPKMHERIFAPNAVPDAMQLYPIDMMLRPGQARAQHSDLADLRDATRRLSPRYGEIRAPVIVVTGDEDQVVDPITQSIRLSREISHSALRLVTGTGHMVHHIHPDEIIEAIDMAWHEADVQSRVMMAPSTRGVARSEGTGAP